MLLYYLHYGTTHSVKLGVNAMKNAVRTQLRLPQNIYQQAKNASLEQNISLNQLIVNALQDYLTKRAYSPTKVKEALELITFALEQINYDNSNI